MCCRHGNWLKVNKRSKNKIDSKYFNSLLTYKLWSRPMEQHSDEQVSSRNVIFSIFVNVGYIIFDGLSNERDHLLR